MYERLDLTSGKGGGAGGGGGEGVTGYGLLGVGAVYLQEQGGRGLEMSLMTARKVRQIRCQ